MQKTKVIAAVRNQSEFDLALKSSVKTIFMLSTNIEIIGEQTALAHQFGKKLLVHVDLADGVAKDVFGIRLLKKFGVDGIISTRTNVIKYARQEGMFTVQRFFIVDSHSIDTTVESLNTSKPDMIEIMPGTIFKVIKKVKALVNMPIVSGGLIETQQEIDQALQNGASAVSTGKSIFWN